MMTPLRCLLAVMLMPGLAMAQQKPTVRATGNHQVQVSFNNANCKNDISCRSTGAPSAIKNCLCDAFVYRAKCASSTSCPDPNSNLAAFTLLPNTGNLTGTVAGSGTSWVFSDTDAALTDGTTFNYSVRNNWTDQTTTTQPGGFASGSVTTPGVTVTHTATLNYTSATCTSATPCWIQLYRATCTDTAHCPIYSPAFTPLINATIPVWNETATGTTWQMIDNGQDAPFADATTYTYVATLCWAKTCPSYSPASAPWIGTTTGTTVPLAPSPGPGNTVSQKRNAFQKFLAMLRGEK